MATILRIKRSSTSGNPNVLAAGELAYSALPNNDINGGDRLYIGVGTETGGNAAEHVVIGGKYFTDLLDHTRGVLTANSAIITDASSKINVINIDNITIDGNTITSTDTNGNINITPDGTGLTNIKNLVSTQLVVSDLQSNRIVLTSTDGRLVEYDSFTWDTGSDAAININLTGSLDVDNLNLDGNTLSVTNLNGDLNLQSNGTSAINFYNGAALRATLDDEKFELDNNLYADIGNIRIQGNRIITTDGSAFSPSTLYLDPNPTGTPGTVVIEGNLQVNGTTTTVNSVNVSVNDPIFVIGDNVAIKTVDTTAASGATQLSLADVENLNVNDTVAGTGIAVGSVIQAIGATDSDGSALVTLSLQTTAEITAGTNITVTTAVDDNRDRGIKFVYHNGVATKTGFFGWDDSETEFTFVPDATESTAVISGARGRAHFGDLKLDGKVTLYNNTSILDGELLIGNSAGTFDKATLSIVPNTAITITNTAGAITFDVEPATTIGTVDTDLGVEGDSDYGDLDLAASGTSAQKKAAQGVASFASEQFTVTDGHVYLSVVDGGTY